MLCRFGKAAVKAVFGRISTEGSGQGGDRCGPVVCFELQIYEMLHEYIMIVWLLKSKQQSTSTAVV